MINGVSTPDALSLWLAGGGLLGSFLRAWITVSQATWSKQTLVDLVIGGAVGFLYPLYPVIAFPPAATMAQKAVIVGVCAYVAGDFVQNAFQRIAGKLAAPMIPPTNINPR